MSNNSEHVHDWGATRLLNPDKQIDFLLTEGIDTTNSKLESRDFYKNKNKVQEAFKKDNGEFDEELYNKWYDQIATEYEYLSAIDTENFILDQYEKSESDFTTKHGKRKNHEVAAEIIANPLDQSMGARAWNIWSDPEISRREAAQNNKYYDPETGTWSDKTVNELGALGLITGDSLVYATYDEDVHDENGNLIHAKGEWKLDEFGNYYTEKAGNKEHINKQFVKISEVLTDDESAWNKIDIFDSDNLETNIPKTVFRAAATVGAMLIPYYNIGKTISLVTAAVNFARTMPQISKTITSFFSEDVKFNKLNTWDNYMQKFRKSKSDYANDNFFSFENIIDMAVDSFSQLSQQRAIAQLPRSLGAYKGVESASNKALLSTIMANPERAKLLQDDPALLQSLIKANPIYRNAENAIKNAEKISTLVSRAYMVATSTEDSYNLARSYGFDTQTSSLISLATYAGIGALFSTDYGRAMLYNTPDYELRRDLRVMVKSYLENNKTKILGQAAVSTTNESKKAFYKNLGTNISNFIKKHISDVKSGHFSIGAGMMAEGLEETAEEVVQDAAIQIGKGWNQLKELFTNKEYTDQYNYFESDPLKRYGTAFFGGALGGGIFKLADRLHFDKNAFTNWKKMLGDNSQLSKEFVTLISQGKADLIISEIERLEASPMMSTTISAFNKEVVTNNVNESQNGVLFGTFKKAIRDLDTFLSNSNLEIDYETFGNIELIRGLRGAWINHENLQDSLFNDYLNIVHQIANEHGTLTSLRASKTPDMEESKKAEVDAQISEKEKTIKDLTEKVRKLVRGEDDSYLGRLMLQANPSISESILPNNKNGLSYRMYGVSYDELTEFGKMNVDNAYSIIEQSGQIERDYYDLWEMWKSYGTSKTITAAFSEFGNLTKTVNGNIFGKFVGDLGYLKQTYWNEDNWTNEDKFAAITAIIDSTVFNSDSDENLKLQNSLKLHFANVLNINTPFFENGDKWTITEDGSTLLDEFKAKLLESIIKIKLQLTDFHEQLKINPDATIDTNDVGMLARNFDNTELLDDLSKILDMPEIVEIDEFPDFSDSFWKIIDEFTDDNFAKILRNELEKLETDKKGYRMSGEVSEKFKKLQEIFDFLVSFSAGSYENYHSNTLGTPFGANMFMNEVFKEKKIPIELLTLDENTLQWLNYYIDFFQTQINKLLTQDYNNSQEILKGDKLTCLRLTIEKLNALANLKENSTIFDGIEEFEKLELSSYVNLEIDDLSDEQMQEAIIINRQRLIEFERTFSKWFNTLTLDSKKEFINNLRLFINENGGNLLGDTSVLSTENKQSFQFVDLYHYLASISFGNVDFIEKLYKQYIDLDNDRVPYDSQEEIIKYAWRYLFRTNRNDEELWFSEIENKTDIHLNIKGLKLICYAGTGKSSTIIPAINWGLSQVFSEKNIIFAANTDKQVENIRRPLKEFGTYFLTEELINKLNSDEISNYENSVIVIDECTYLSVQDIDKLTEASKKYNIDVIYIGDVQQSGIKNIKNIDSVAMLSTPTLGDSRRAKTDIQRLNQIALDNLSDKGHRRLESSYAVKLQYYDNENFSGIKFDVENILSIEYIQEFFERYGLDPSTSILIFTHNVKLFDNKEFLSKFPNITITDSVREIQGSEWDYVFTDMMVNETEKEYDQYLDIRTLLTRANYGTICFNNIKFQSNPFTFMPIMSKFPPVEISISKETIEEFKKFKKAILDALEIEESEVEKKNEKSLPVIKLIEPPFENITIAQSTPGFILPDSENVDQHIVNILYQMLTTDDQEKISLLRKQLPKEYQEGEFLIKFFIADTYKLGNIYRDEKILSTVYPWLVWKPSNLEINDVPISLFHNPSTASEFGLETTKASEIIFSLDEEAGKELSPERKNYWLKGNNGNPVIKYFRIPNSIKIFRSANTLAIQNAETNSTTLQATVERGKMKVKFGDTPAFFKMTRPVYFDTTIKGSSSTPYFKEIDEALKEQQILYNKIANLILDVTPKSKIGSIKDIFIDLQNITHIVKNVRGEEKSTSYTVKGVPKLWGSFVSFVELDDDTPVNKLYELSASYYSWIIKTNEHLNNIITYINDVLNGGNKYELQKALLSIIPSDVSILSFNPEFIIEKSEIEDTIDNLSTVSEINKGYKNRLARGMINVLDGIFKVYIFNGNVPNKSSDFINKKDIEFIKEYFEKKIQDIKIKFKHNYNNVDNLSDDDLFDTILNYLSAHSDVGLSAPEPLLQSDLVIITKVFGDILKDIYTYKKDIFSKIIEKIQKDSRSPRSKFGASKVLYSQLLKDNKINIHTIGIAPITEGGELSIMNKVIQRAQIHMYIPDSIEKESFEVFDGNIEKITEQEGDSIDDINDEIALDEIQSRIIEYDPNYTEILPEIINLLKENDLVDEFVKVFNNPSKENLRSFKSKITSDDFQDLRTLMTIEKIKKINPCK